MKELNSNINRIDTNKYWQYNDLLNDVHDGVDSKALMKSLKRMKQTSYSRSLILLLKENQYYDFVVELRKSAKFEAEMNTKLFPMNIRDIITDDVRNRAINLMLIGGMLEPDAIRLAILRAKRLKSKRGGVDPDKNRSVIGL